MAINQKKYKRYFLKGFLQSLPECDIFASSNYIAILFLYFIDSKILKNLNLRIVEYVYLVQSIHIGQSIADIFFVGFAFKIGIKKETILALFVESPFG